MSGMNKAGLEHIVTLREERKREVKTFIPRPRVVGGFAFKHNESFTEKFLWVVSFRKDPRHGVLQPGPVTDYGKSLFEEMFRKW